MSTCRAVSRPRTRSTTSGAHSAFQAPGGVLARVEVVVDDLPQPVVVETSEDRG
jgi:hypothetical protein